MLQLRDESGLTVGQDGGSLGASDAASVLDGRAELDMFFRAALPARAEEEVTYT
jgi:hypothetical protein